MIREIKSRAVVMDPFVKDIFIKHPLVREYATVNYGSIFNSIRIDHNTAQHADLNSSISYHQGSWGL